jgi:hypothetical protein
MYGIASFWMRQDFCRGPLTRQHDTEAEFLFTPLADAIELPPKAKRVELRWSGTMKVRVQFLFEPPGEDDRASLLSLGRSLTNEPQSVVGIDGKPGWLVVEFTMPTEAQYKAVEKIDRAIRFYSDNRQDSIIEFPKTEAERERSRRKAERRRTRRRVQGQG